MPIEEYRKSMEELKPSKRAQHRRRFAKMDEITESVTEVLNNYKNKGVTTLSCGRLFFLRTLYGIIAS